MTPIDEGHEEKTEDRVEDGREARSAIVAG
jgi:hypothetical protein